MKTADLSDQYNDVQVCEPGLISYGAHLRFNGPIRTVSCFEDFGLVKQVLQTPGEGAVLVIDAGGSTRCAMVGDILARIGIENGWVGIIVNGMIRDSADINLMPIGIRALGTNPKRSAKENIGESDVPVSFTGVTFQPGHFVYTDEDGILVSENRMSL